MYSCSIKLMPERRPDNIPYSAPARWSQKISPLADNGPVQDVARSYVLSAEM